MARRTEDIGRTAVLHAARKRFLQWGYSGTSTAALAEDLGITKAALYYHFSDKEALFLAVVAEYLTEIGTDLRALSPVFDSVGAEAGVTALAEVFLSRGETSAQIQQLSFQESRHLSPEGTAHLSAAYHETMVRPVSNLLERAADLGWIRGSAEDEPALIWIFLGLLTAFLQPSHGGPGARKTTSTAAARLFLSTLSPHKLSLHKEYSCFPSQ